MLEFGDAIWTVLVQRATSLLLQQITRVTSVPHGIWTMPISATGYHGHGMDPYVPSRYIPNIPPEVVPRRPSPFLEQYKLQCIFSLALC